MSRKDEGESQLSLDAVDQLLVLCEEVTRATPEGARRFIEPAPGVLSRAKAEQHNIILGRRGSGKSSLLRKMAADLTVDRQPIAFVDMETFKGHSYPDVLISVLIKSLREFKKWLDGAATNPATKTTFWKRLFGTTPKRPAFNKKTTAELVERLQALISELERQLVAPESAAIVKTQKLENDSAVEGAIETEIGGQGAKVSTDVSLRSSVATSSEQTSTYVSHKVAYLHQHIIAFQAFFNDVYQLY